MVRHNIPKRLGWEEKLAQQGFFYHTQQGQTYWDESVYYSFSLEQIGVLENATNTLYGMCLNAVQYVIDKHLFYQLKIPAMFVPMIIKSWEREDASLYGRFDLSWNGNLKVAPKLLEFNADTPTSLFEASIIQWHWLQDQDATMDQFNALHERIIDLFQWLKPQLKAQVLYFSSITDSTEDYTTTEYLKDCAMQAGITTAFIDVTAIGWDGKQFVDLNDKPILHIFKLYPWEWLMHEPFAAHLLTSFTQWYEPSWKLILQSKGILAMLWELFPHHPLLLEAHCDSPHDMQDYIQKPFFSREGANVSIFNNNQLRHKTLGDYGEEGFVYQALAMLPCFNGNYPLIGSWIIGTHAAGIGIRESDTPITDNSSRFVPHAVRG